MTPNAPARPLPARPAPRRSRRGGRARARVAWGLVLFAALQAGLLAAIGARPDLRDPEYGLRLAALRDRQRDAPGRPLVVLLGSSRVACGVDPGAMPGGRAGRGPVVLNFGQCRAGPVHELVVLHRLFADGARPALVVVETHPTVYFRDRLVHDSLALDRFGWSDLGVLERYTETQINEDVGPVVRHRLAAGLVPWSAQRRTLLARCAPDLVGPDARKYENEWRDVTGWGWLAVDRFARPIPDPAARADLARSVGDGYAAAAAVARLTDRSRRAFREMKDLCDRHGARMAFALLPDSFESRYPPAARARAAAELSALAGELGVPVLDFHAWGRGEEFWDGVHLTHAGAARFSADFEEPLVRLAGGP